ncbi:pyridoxamine 5'-phosphate oxidase family protein [Paenibacillus ihumii]|uniref:pyridoxamine 5'-phosphate oxidase family protein n=1 Tax=Paenibacillus ihumii TaxID=687436 RepID=UPI0006D7A9B0|nr:pyridoxamine 5'-phosphate oxidase family protein [Paenibacillus ihumii]
MGQAQLEQNIIQAIEKNKFCAMGTVENGKPKVRYMAIYNEGMSIHLATNRKTHKIEELRDNPNVCLLLGYELGGTKEVVEIEGTCEITKNAQLRQQVWNDDLRPWFAGPDDPNYVILDVTPTRIEYTAHGSDPQMWRP